MIKIASNISADKWLKDHMEDVVNKYAGRYVVIVDNKGIVFSDKDGTPNQIVKKAKAKYPHTIPLFFRVPRIRDFSCALNAE